MIRKKIFILFGVILFARQIAFAGELSVTEEFRNQIVQADYGEAKSRNVIQILKSHAEVKAEFGGSYVTSISNSKNREWKEEGNVHWFYYVNGVLAHVGASLYHPGSDDNIWWDLHPWDGKRYIGAVIGAWPEPFLHGYNGKVLPTRIWVTDPFEKDGRLLQKVLLAKGVQSVDLLKLKQNSAIDFEKSFPIYIGTWTELIKTASLSDLFQHAEQVGLFLDFNESGDFSPLTWEGKKIKSHQKAAAIIALKSAAEAVNPIWFVTGTDDILIARAVDFLIRSEKSIKGRSGVFLTEEGITSIPIFDSLGKIN